MILANHAVISIVRSNPVRPTRGPVKRTWTRYIEWEASWGAGGETSRYWMQVIYGKKSCFQNPQHQNAMHVWALAKATGLPIGQRDLEAPAATTSDDSLAVRVPPGASGGGAFGGAGRTNDELV